jgi:hypothetical protein
MALFASEEEVRRRRINIERGKEREEREREKKRTTKSAVPEHVQQHSLHCSFFDSSSPTPLASPFPVVFLGGR